MKKLYLLALLFCIQSYSQCENYGQLLIAELKQTRFFDADNGIAFGQGTMIATNDAGAHWHFVVKENITISLPQELNAGSIVKIYNISGQLVFEKTGSKKAILQ